ncbi:RraA family protein [Phytomonospora endophytica]|uniref:Putative 4-hydroxy-4-methyl-2-oxoglutarate aldolase n=1 Tax=Phytomonospora endophytica TaxID=714109 RepID=A0A841FGN2_9ACTN|nr:RraA family protein [Phytomonospora endophytica]MBB6035024.1 regulator of RNase E activity RraA [Phytomonospora endophytica]GIG68278.1 demethylmenaquinone methyltransferase [Phytomonospora endophytica]
MTPTELADRFATLTTAHIADACVRDGVPVRCAPAGTKPVAPGMRAAGRVLPTRHAGSVDVFLEALEESRPGDVLVADNGGRLDESCIGDLIVAEVAAAELAGVIVWGLHRDTLDVTAIGLPVFSLGAIPTGPLAPTERAEDALTSAKVGEWTVDTGDLAFADEDGALFVPAERVGELLNLAEKIRDTERRQAARIRDGAGLRGQLLFGRFLERREKNPALTFREHLRSIGGAIEE